MARFGWLLVFTMGMSSSTFAQFVVAHRGASFDAPENTMAAFRLAWEQNADAIEGDFHLTKDQKIVCIHDKTTKRTSPEHPELLVADSTLEQLQKLDVGSWKDSKFKGERMPILDDVLSTVPSGKRIFVEIKCGPEILPFLKPTLEKSGLAADQIVIISFNDEVVRGARELMPQFKANWLTGYKENQSKTAWNPNLSSVIGSLEQTRATGLGTNGKREIVDKDFAKAVIDAGFEFHVWTVNDAIDAKYFASLGALSITTDKPAEIRRSLN